MKKFLSLLMLFSLLSLFVAPEVLAASKHHIRKSFSSEKSTPVLYSRDNITLVRKTLPQAQPMPWHEQAPQQEPDLVLDVEIRDGSSLYKQNDWINLSSYSDKSGIMMVFPEPAMQPVVHSPQYAPVDVLFIDKNGKIAQIVPNLSLSELDQEIYPDEPVLAFLFLKGGACAELSINAGDVVQYSLFKKPPTILNAPKQNDMNIQKTSPGNNNDHP
jgi:uncharacterized membrane protein (UPF0127 family)